MSQSNQVESLLRTLNRAVKSDMFINPGVFLFSDYDHIDKKSALLKLDNFTNHFDGMRSMDFDF